MCRWNDGRFTDKPIPKQGVQGAAGPVRTHDDRELDVQFGWKCPIQDAESSALPASQTAVGQKSGEFDNEDLPSHTGFGASVHLTGKRQQRNREGNSSRAMVEILPIRHMVSESFRRVSSAEGCDRTLRQVRRSCAR